MNDELEERLRATLHEVAGRIPATEEEDRALVVPLTRARMGMAHRARSWALVGAAAALILGLAVAVAVVDRDGGEVGTGPATQPPASSPPSAPTAPSTGPPSSEGPPPSSTEPPPSTSEDDLPNPFAEPLPPPTPEPPRELVAVTADGRLVVVDTATGAERRTLTGGGEWSFGDPTAAPPSDGPGPNVVESVALAPDGAWVWFGDCCEPAAGNVYRVPFDGSAPPERALSGYGPSFGSTSRFVVTADLMGLLVSDLVGDLSLIWESPEREGEVSRVVLSPDGRRLVARVGPGESGPLMALARSDLVGAEADREERGPGRPGTVLPGEAWGIPTFRRDGRLVVADACCGARSPVRVLDPVTGAEVAPALDLGGRPLALDHDPTGEWLLAVVADGDDGTGVLRWRGPDGQEGTVPGRYRAASW